MNRPKLNGTELEELIKNRKAARELMIDAAHRGDPVCGGLFALEASVRGMPGLDYVVESLDYDDQDDEERPF